MKTVIEKQHFYKHPIQKVWDAISNEKHISEWFIQADFKPKSGYKYTFIHEETKVSGEVLKANPVNELEYTWMVNDTPEETTVNWALEEQDGGTLVTITHSGLQTYPENMVEKMFNMFGGGWVSAFTELDKYLDK